MHLPGEGGSKSALWLTSKEYWGSVLSGPSVPLLGTMMLSAVFPERITC